MPSSQPRILLVIARGEAVRNFLYSDTLSILSKNARVTLLSVMHDQEFCNRFGGFVEQIIPLREYRENSIVTNFRYLVHSAHYRWLWSENAKHMWALHDSRAKTFVQRLKRNCLKLFARFFANRIWLRFLTWVDLQLSWILRPSRDFEEMFRELRPDLVFNCSHIHGPQADLPMRAAHHLKIPTAAFIFSWDNLTTRSRIFIPYDFYLMWNEGMKTQLLEQYPEIPATGRKCSYSTWREKRSR